MSDDESDTVRDAGDVPADVGHGNADDPIAPNAHPIVSTPIMFKVGGSTVRCAVQLDDEPESWRRNLTPICRPRRRDQTTRSGIVEARRN